MAHSITTWISHVFHHMEKYRKREAYRILPGLRCVHDWATPVSRSWWVVWTMKSISRYVTVNEFNCFVFVLFCFSVGPNDAHGIWWVWSDGIALRPNLTTSREKTWQNLAMGLPSSLHHIQRSLLAAVYVIRAGSLVFFCEVDVLHINITR